MRKGTLFSVFIAIGSLIFAPAFGQTPTYPESGVDQSYIPPSPNAQAFQSYGNEPVALYAGMPQIAIPIYTVKCGSLSLPISLSYNYNGFFPLQDASWVGLGWNLNAGGAISRIVEGAVDNRQSSGYNYNQYNLIDTLFNSTTLDSFLQKAYNPNLTYGLNAYDMAPDIYDAEFNGYSGKFIYYNNKAYMLSYNKQLGISLTSPTGLFTITTDNGTQYIFSNTETTTSYFYGGSDSTQQSYISAWVLNVVVSADKLDTILLTYATNTWSQAQISYQNSYTLSTGSQADMGYDPASFKITPSISSQTLVSIRCRNSRISFIPDGTSRTDVVGTYPRLKEIDVIDSLTGNIIKKNTFTYEYFGQSSGTPVALYQRLALKQFNSINPQLSTDSLTYKFSYINEFGTFPVKGTYGVDYFGYYNGNDGNPSLLPPYNTPFYSPSPPSSTFGTGIRGVNFSKESYGALDTIVYPAGGYTAFTYEANAAATADAPGIRIKSSIAVSNNSTSPPVKKSYTYASGIITNPPNFTGPAFILVQNTTTNNYNTYKASTNSGGIGGINLKFYYPQVTESIASGPEIHKTDHYFTSYPGLFLDVRETQRIEYINPNNANTFIPVSKSITNYTAYGPMDTSFTAAAAYIDTEYTNVTHTPKIWYSYGYTYAYWTTCWVHPTSQQITQYGKLGDSISTTTLYFYNATTNNLASTTTQTLSDGQSLIQRFKYPEDYGSGITGNMVSARVLNPVIENQTWLYKNSSDSVLIAGNIMQYDQTIYKPVNSYAIETTKPIAGLNNETISGGKFATLLSDSRYVLKGQITYDGNSNLNVVNKASDINVSYIWDYAHSNPIAEVKNALQADIAFSSFESNGTGNWTFTGSANSDASSPTGSKCYNLGQTSGNITKTGLTSTSNYIVSYWLKSGTPLTITGTVSGYPKQGKTINGWTYFEHKVTGQTAITVSGTGTLYIDELRLYPATAQMTTYTYIPLIGMSSQCDADNRISYYQYDPFGRLKVVLDQDHNIIKTVQYHYIGESNE